MRDERLHQVDDLRDRNGLTRKCEVDGCSHHTRERKPFCPEHIDRLPYVQALMQKVDFKRSELDIIRATGRAPNRSLFEEEIVCYLKMHGPKTVKKLAREINIEYAVLIKIVRKISAIRVSYTKRCEYMVRLK